MSRKRESREKQPIKLLLLTALVNLVIALIRLIQSLIEAINR